jgi:hypothetical protein
MPVAGRDGKKMFGLAQFALYCSTLDEFSHPKEGTSYHDRVYICYIY